jgi:hypothetical protein
MYVTTEGGAHAITGTAVGARRSRRSYRFARRPPRPPEHRTVIGQAQQGGEMVEGAGGTLTRDLHGV